MEIYIKQYFILTSLQFFKFLILKKKHIQVHIQMFISIIDLRVKKNNLEVFLMLVCSYIPGRWEGSQSIQCSQEKIAWPTPGRLEEHPPTYMYMYMYTVSLGLMI